MKLTGQTAKNFFIKPDEKAKIILLYGSSISHILYKRDVLKAQLLSRQSEKSIQIIKTVSGRHSFTSDDTIKSQRADMENVIKKGVAGHGTNEHSKYTTLMAHVAIFTCL